MINIFNQDTFNDYSLPMIEILDEVQLELMLKVARQLKRGKNLSDNDWKVLMLQSVSRLEQSMANTVEMSTASQRKEIDKIINKSINEGLTDTDKQFEVSDLTASSKAEFFSLNSKILETVSDKLTQDTVNANLTMLRSASLDYVDIVNRTLAKKELGAITRQEATKQIMRQWSQQGIPALVDRGGKRWKPDAYINMVVRTNSLQIAKTTQERRAVDYGHDLILTSQHGDQSPEHAPYANKIYSLTGNSAKYPSFSKATSAGFMTRPNCRHTYSFYFPGTSQRQKRMTGTKQSYKLSQEQRKLERTIRAQKREIAVLEELGEDTTAEKALLRDYQADMRAFINKSGRTRQRDREQI